MKKSNNVQVEYLTMKKPIYLIITFVFLVSCNDNFLDVSPTDQLTDATLWSSPENANLFLNDIYDNLNAGPWGRHWLGLPLEITSDPLENLSGNSIAGNLGNPSVNLFADGTYGPSNPYFRDQWEKMYENIRKTNVFITRISESDFKEETRNNMVAQARFLRAYFYKQLIDLYGGVPLITSILDRNGGEDINYPRNTYEECVTFIQQEMEEAVEYLPATVPVSEEGRVTKGAALALKGSMELYAGKWEEAAATNREIMQSGVYSLFPDYESLFWMENENNREIIFAIQFEPIIRGHRIDTHLGVVQQDEGFGWGGFGPTQNLVDAYEFKDGLTEAEGSAMFDPSHPYENRDERFYATIVYDGSDWRGTTVYTRLGIPNNINQLNISGSGNASTRTGYYAKKRLDPSVAPGRGNLDQYTSGQDYVVYRYAEILLNYAEAQNEAVGPDQTVYDAINRIRQRVNQPPLPEGLSQDEMRERIRRERRIELAFEGKYFYDIRRWHIAEEIFSEPIKAMKITEESGQLRYEKVPSETITFDPAKNYLMPIPQTVIDRNPEIDQNPGY